MGKPPTTSIEMTPALWVGAAASGNPDPTILPNLAESPDSHRLLGPLWTASGLTLQGSCRLYCGESWRSGLIVATGTTFALVATSAGLARCSDRRNILTEDEAVLFKRQTAAFRRLCKKRMEGRTNG